MLARRLAVLAGGKIAVLDGRLVVLGGRLSVLAGMLDVLAVLPSGVRGADRTLWTLGLGR